MIGNPLARQSNVTATTQAFDLDLLALELNRSTLLAKTEVDY